VHPFFLDEILIQLEPPIFIPHFPFHPALRIRFEAKINKRRTMKTSTSAAQK